MQWLTPVDISSDPANLGLGYLWAGSLPLGASAPLTLSAAAVPEPATMLLIGIGLVGVAAARRRQLRRVARYNRPRSRSSAQPRW